MSDASRLARQHFSKKPQGLPYGVFPIDNLALRQIQGKLDDAAIEAFYAAVISYIEAINGLGRKSISWSVIQLYYSCYYSVKSLLFLRGVVPFNCGDEMVLDTNSSLYHRGGRSSHQWNWRNLVKIPNVSGEWFASADAQAAYAKLRKHREDVNYNHYFTDPDFHDCLVSSEPDIVKRFRTYRDDTMFFYTYMPEHLALAFPTALVSHIDAEMRGRSLRLSGDKLDHASKIWKFRDRCPLGSAP